MEKNNYEVPIESLLYSNYIKYDRLTQLVAEAYKGSNATVVNIFIDIYSLIQPLYRSEVLTKENSLIMSSSMINLCAHLRHFFRNRYRVETNIYLVHSYNIPEYNKKMWLGYNKNHEKVVGRRANVNELINHNLTILNTLTPYLPDIYFLYSEFEAGVLIYDTICYNEKAGNTNPNIVITKDPYLYQLVGLCRDLTIFRPKKTNSEDVSYIVNKSNVLSKWFTSKNVIIDGFDGMDAGLCSLIMSLSRCPERSIESLFTIPKAAKMVYSAVSNHKILNGYNSNTQNIWNSLYTKDFDKITYDIFDKRFKVMDILSQYLVYMNVPHEQSKFINLVDPDTVREINNKYFEKYPLDLNNL